MASTSELKNGTIINFNNDLHSVVSVEHRTPGNLRAFYQVKLKNQIIPMMILLYQNRPN